MDASSLNKNKKIIIFSKYIHGTIWVMSMLKFTILRLKFFIETGTAIKTVTIYPQLLIDPISGNDQAKKKKIKRSITIYLM